MVGELAALGSAFLWALTNTVMGSQSGRVPALVISTMRCLYAALFLGVIAVAFVVTGGFTYPSARSALAIAAAGTLGLGIGDTLYIGSLRRVGVSRAFPISMAAYPLLTVVLAIALLGEDITVPVALGTVLIIAGIYLIVSRGEEDRPGSGNADDTDEAPINAHGERDPSYQRPSTSLGVFGVPIVSRLLAASCRVPHAARGLALVLVATILWAVSSVWLRPAAEGVQPVLVQALRLPPALLVTAAITAAAGHSLRPDRYGRRALGALLVSGVVGTGFGSLLFVVAVQEAGAARTAVLSSTAPLFGLPMAALMLGERVTWRIGLGTALSIAGIWLVV